jgi:divalent metal cation (Fe/Co/Zn/Cd) transporter
MAQIVQNKWLNYWICGLIFVLISAVAGIVINAILALPIIGWVIYIIIMPLVMGYLVDWVSDRWMD